MPTCPATASAARALSPVSIATSIPIRCSPAIAAADSGLIVSASASAPTIRPSRMTTTAVRPLASHSASTAGAIGAAVRRVFALLRASDPYLGAVDLGANPPAGQRAEVDRRGDLEPSLARGVDDRHRDRMLRAGLGRGGEREHRVAMLAGRGPHVGDRQLSGRDRSRLVEHDRVDVLAALEDLGAVDQQPETRAASRARQGSRPE